MINVILALHLMVAVALVGMVLMQRSEGGALGMGGGSGSMISGRGAANVLVRGTGGRRARTQIRRRSAGVFAAGPDRRDVRSDHPSGAEAFRHPGAHHHHSGNGAPRARRGSAFDRRNSARAGIRRSARGPDS
jgi:preprotein translocase subunit SecG